MAGFPPGCREQGPGFLFAWENRSRARGRTRNQPRACETWGRKRQGARIAHRRCARIARCSRGLSPCPGKQKLSAGLHPESSRVRARRGEEKDRERELPTAGVRELLSAAAGFLPARENRSSVRARTRKQPRACETWGRKRQGARIAHRRCARIARRSRAGEKVLRNFAGKGLTIRTSYIIINNAPQ